MQARLAARVCLQVVLLVTALQSRRCVNLTDPLLVSLHLPKTAGTSFAVALQAHYGEHYQADYDDLPMQVAPWRRKLRALRGGWQLRRTGLAQVACLHGHFLPAKYLLALSGRQATFITWLRHPVERVVSHYHYWRRDYDGRDPYQPLRNRMLSEDWSLERFALGPEMRDLYCQYLWRFDPGQFAFIGITERYAEDLARFAESFRWRDCVLEHALHNPDRCDGDYQISRKLREQLIRHHACDMALYQASLAGQRQAAAGREMRAGLARPQPVAPSVGSH